VEAKEGILWVGRSDRVKRPDLFLKLARHFPDLPFTMICQRATGDDRYEALVREAKSIRHLKFIERVPFSEVDAYFQRSRVLVNTSDSEGFPNTFVQACKAGTAILSLNVNPDGFLDKHACGLCTRGDWQAFENQLAHLITGSNAAKLGANGRAYVEAHHNLETIIRDYKLLFERPVK
jgi:glycosyltransferase involved in cell wall biosynthesis